MILDEKTKKIKKKKPNEFQHHNIEMEKKFKMKNVFFLKTEEIPIFDFFLMHFTCFYHFSTQILEVESQF